MRHVEVYDTKTNKTFVKDFYYDYEAENFIRKCKHGTRLIVIATWTDVGYD